MRSVFWFLFLAAVAVALAMLVGSNTATVTVFWHPWRLDMSLNLVLFSLVAGFVLFYLGIRGIALLRGLPLQAQRWRSQQQERSVYVSLLDAVVHQLSGRFVRAQAAAEHAAQLLESMPPDALDRHPRWRVLAQLLLAESARSLSAHDRQRLALQVAMSVTGPDAAPAQEAAVLRAVAWAVEERQADQAQAWMARLPQGAARRIQAVRLRLRIAQLEQDSGAAADMVRLLTKHKAYSAGTADTLLKGLIKEALQQAHDAEQLLATWKGLDHRERADEGVALAFLERLATWTAGVSADAHGALDGVLTPEGRRQAEDALRTVWSRYDTLTETRRYRLVRWFETHLGLLGPEWLQRVEEVQQARPADASLQYLAGQMLMHRQLWGKATQLLTQASRQLSHTDLLRRTWCALARLAEQRGESGAAAEHWRRAAELP